MPTIATSAEDTVTALEPHPDEDEADSAVAEESPTEEPESASKEAPRLAADSARTTRQLSISLRGLAVGAVILLVAVAAGVLGWLYVDAKGQLNAQAQEASNRERAESLAMDYAVNAAEMDYQDFAGWKVKLVKGTSPELKEKLTKAANSMEQVLAPLQWRSTARPLAARVRSSAGGVYTVDSFVSVLTKTVQAPEGLQSTATYSISIDSRNDWQITDVGGVDAALGR